MMNEKLVVLIVNDIVIFPNSEVRIEFDNDYDKKVVEIVDKIEDNLMLIVNPIEESNLDITTCPKYGVLGRIKLKMNVPNGKTRIVIEGLGRVEISSYEEEGKFFKANYKIIEYDEDNEDYTSYYKLLVKSLEKYISKVPYMGNAILSQLSAIDNLSDLCDLIVNYLPLSYKEKKKFITTIEPIERAKYLIEDMNRDMKFAELEQKIESEVEKELSDSQKEYYLREKIRLMQEELGDVNSKDSEVEKYYKKLAKLKCSKKIKDKIKREIDRYNNLNSNSPELGMIREYIEWMISLPWNIYTKDTQNLSKVKETLDQSHFALEDVKERILEYLAVKENTNNLRLSLIHI